MAKDDSLRTMRQATVFVTKEGETTLAYWLEYELGGQTKSMAVVLKPERCLLPRDKLAIGFAEQVFDVSLVDLKPWLHSKGYRLAGPITEPEA